MGKRITLGYFHEPATLHAAAKTALAFVKASEWDKCRVCAYAPAWEDSEGKGVPDNSPANRSGNVTVTGVGADEGFLRIKGLRKTVAPALLPSGERRSVCLYVEVVGIE